MQRLVDAGRPTRWWTPLQEHLLLKHHEPLYEEQRAKNNKERHVEMTVYEPFSKGGAELQERNRKEEEELHPYEPHA